MGILFFGPAYVHFVSLKMLYRILGPVCGFKYNNKKNVSRACNNKFFSKVLCASEKNSFMLKRW